MKTSLEGEWKEMKHGLQARSPTNLDHRSMAISGDNETTVLPSTGLPSTGLPSTGLPSTGLPSTGLPSTGLPSTILPTTSLPSSGLHASGLPAPGLASISHPVSHETSKFHTPKHH